MMVSDKRMKVASCNISSAIAQAVRGEFGWDVVAQTIHDALALASARGSVASSEHDERTRDLESLTEERDAAIADRVRYAHASAVHLDSLDAEKRLHALTMQRLEQATGELEKSRALVDELRAQLAAPTVQSAAVTDWLCLHEERRKAIVNSCRITRSASGNLDWGFAADALDSLSMPAPTDERADEADRLRDERDALQACNDRQRITIEDLQRRLAGIASAAKVGS